MNGYLQTNNIPRVEAMLAGEYWDKCTKAGLTPVLNDNIRFIPLPDDSRGNNVIVRCGYCGQWAAVKTECKHCGASIIE